MLSRFNNYREENGHNLKFRNIIYYLLERMKYFTKISPPSFLRHHKFSDFDFTCTNWNGHRKDKLSRLGSKSFSVCQKVFGCVPSNIWCAHLLLSVSFCKFCISPIIEPGQIIMTSIYIDVYARLGSFQNIFIH